jgi:ribosomal protein S18 acetylase RimI-like enzyme
MIKKYCPENRAELIKIFKLNTPTYFNPKERIDFEKYLDSYGDTYLTIYHENKIAGGTGFQITDNGVVGRITWIFLHPNCTGLGLGKQSVEYCLEILKSTSGVKKLVVTTSQLAFKFFEKFGYQLVYTEKDYWGKGLDLYTMEINL